MCFKKSNMTIILLPVIGQKQALVYPLIFNNDFSIYLHILICNPVGYINAQDTKIIGAATSEQTCMYIVIWHVWLKALEMLIVHTIYNDLHAPTMYNSE